MHLKSKQNCRVHLRKKREQIPEERRQQAEQNAHVCLEEISRSSMHYVLSYASFGTELDMWPLNSYLAECGKLVLPKVEGTELGLFHVSNLSFLKPNYQGILEPDPDSCLEVMAENIELAFIPGLGFDSMTGHRIGYGKGYYDRLIARFPLSAISRGIGFKEQEISSLPFSAFDQPLGGHYLF